MPEQKSVKQEFLNKFIEEMITNVKECIYLKEKEEKEKIRLKHELEIEKLRIKFSNYSEKVKEENLKNIAEQVKFQKKSVEPLKLQQEQISKPVINQNPALIIKAIERPEPIPKKPLLTQNIKPTQNSFSTIVDIPIPQNQPTLIPGEIDFGKIIFLVKDPLVTYIEVPGIEKNILIKRAGFTIKTQITLSKEELLAIIKSFSEKARIPLIEGMLNARISNLEMSAVVSEDANTSFIVKKNSVPEMNRQTTQLQKPVMQIPTVFRTPNPLSKSAQTMPKINRPFN